MLSGDSHNAWADTSRRGYVMMTVTPQSIAGEWLFMRSIATRDTALAETHRMVVRAVTGPLGLERRNAAHPLAS